jgi:hypothetical protein
MLVMRHSQRFLLHLISIVEYLEFIDDEAVVFKIHASFHSPLFGGSNDMWKLEEYLETEDVIGFIW